MAFRPEAIGASTAVPGEPAPIASPVPGEDRMGTRNSDGTLIPSREGSLVPADSSQSGEKRAGHVPATLLPGPTFAALLVNLKRRAGIALVLGVALAGFAGYAAWKLTPSPHYAVRATVHLASVQEVVLGSNHQDTETRFAYFQKTQMAFVKSQLVLEGVLNNPEVADLKTVRAQQHPKDWLLQLIEVDFKIGPEILSITLKGDEAQELKILANAVMQSYLGEFMNTEEKRRAERLKLLNQMLTEYRTNLTNRRKELGKLLAKVGGTIRTTGGIQDQQLKQLDDAQKRLAEVESEIQGLQRKLGEQQNRLGAPRSVLVPPAAVDKQLLTDPIIQRFQKEIAELIAREIELESKYGEKAQAEIDRKGIRVDREALQTRLEAYTGKKKEEITAQMWGAARDQAIANITQIQRDLRLTEDAYRKASGEIASMGRNLKDVGQDSYQLSLVSKEVEDGEKQVSAVMSDIRTLNLQQLAPPRAKPLDKAVISTLSAGKKKILLAGGAAGGVFGLVVFLIAWWEFNKRKINSADEIIHGFGVRLVGTLPRLPGRVRRHVGGTAPAYSRWTESIDSYRMLLFRTTGNENLRVLMVTSSVPGEGKTSLSSHLAVSIARSGRKTLLVDADLRKPTLHRVFGTTIGPGLSEVLRGEYSLEQAVRPTPLPGLWFLSAGELTSAAVNALGSEKARELVAGMREEFEMVLFDSAPLLPVADTLSVAQHVDGVVLALMQGYSQMPKLSATLHRLKTVNVPVLGAVINGTDQDVYANQYYATVPSGTA
jgi:capsular exopolysaccharide synthesis family protein